MNRLYRAVRDSENPQINQLINLEKENRFYRIETQRDLFGDLNVIQIWGSRIRNWQRQKVVPVKDENEAGILTASILKKREKRGYVAVQKEESTR